jgi:hypothetical protein
MDPHRFDGLTRGFATGLSRRRLLGAAAAAALGAALGRRPAAAGCTPYGRPCAAGDGCCNGAACQGGVCRCPAGTSVCNTASGPACVACPPDQLLGAGCRCLCRSTGREPGPDGCPCPTGLTACGAACVDTASDAAHCGGCGLACVAGPNTGGVACRGGACVGAGCLPGFADCDGDPATGCETALGTTDDCGACGDACPGIENGEPVCEAGACATFCSPGFKRCAAGGPCVPDATCCDATDCRAADPANCEAAPLCEAGGCVYPPADDSIVCRDASCADGTATAATYCTGEALGCPAPEPVSCAPHETCAAGACVCVPTAPATFTGALGTGSSTYAACGWIGTYYYAAYPIAHCGGLLETSLDGDGSGGTLRFPRVELYDGGFDPADPCAGKIAEGIYSCANAGTEISKLALENLSPGAYVVVASTGFATGSKDGVGGTYTLNLGALTPCP